MHVANEPWTPCPSSPLICAAVTVFAAVRNALSNVGGMPIMEAYCSRSHGAITLASQMCPFAEENGAHLTVTPAAHTHVNCVGRVRRANLRERMDLPHRHILAVSRALGGLLLVPKVQGKQQ